MPTIRNLLPGQIAGQIAAASAAALLLAGCASQDAAAPKPAWVEDLDRRHASAFVDETRKPESAVAQGVAPLSFSVESSVDAETFAARLHGVAERCWVVDDAAYTASRPSPTVVALAYRPETPEAGAEPVEALRIVARRAAAGGEGLTIDAVGPLAAESHRRIIERGLRQASADLSACL